MRYTVRGTQVSYGEAIGIMAVENYAPYVPGDTANASSYDFPVRFERLPGSTPARLFAHDESLVDAAVEVGRKLVGEGVRAVTGDCGFLALHQNRIAAELEVPVFISSLLQLDFIDRITGPAGKTGIITATSASLDRQLLGEVTSVPDDRLRIEGLEEKPEFVAAVFDEKGSLDTDLVEAEVLEAAQALTEDGTVRAILLECSLLPPYAAAVQEQTGLPVFDYNTMINYVYSAVVRRRFDGFM
ncbi:MAG: aspartate/glutamate racemase family protein [Spirochaetaceae bacterium]